MKTMLKASSALMVILMSVALSATPAFANTVDIHVIHVHGRFVDRHTCPFDIHVHEKGTFRDAEYFDNSGFRYKSLLTAGGGRLTFTETANDTTLTMQNQTFLVVLRYNADGSFSSITETGLIFKFTTPGGGVVLLDTGRLVLDGDGNVIWRAGPHQQLDGDVDAFCAAFG